MSDDKVPGWFGRISDYMNDPFIPPNKWNPYMWLEAAWYCLWNRRMYEDRWWEHVDKK